MNFYNKHYITVDEQGRITGGWSDGPNPTRDTSGAVLLNDKGGYQFRLFPGGEENPNLYHWPHRIPLYKYDGGEVVKRTEDEIEADITAIPIPDPAPTQLDQIEAQVTYTAMMTDTLLEV